MLLNNMRRIPTLNREELRKLYKALKILASERVLVSTLTAAAQAEAQPKGLPRSRKGSEEKEPRKALGGSTSGEQRPLRRRIVLETHFSERRTIRPLRSVRGR